MKKEIMSASDWVFVRKYFSWEEFGSKKMNKDLIFKLYYLRFLADCPILVTSGFAKSGHSAKSKHYSGDAADVQCPRIDLMTFYRLAEQVGFEGLGVYNDWFRIHAGKKVYCGGLHCDVGRHMPLRWFRESELGGEKIYYYNVSTENFLEKNEKYILENKILRGVRS